MNKDDRIDTLILQMRDANKQNNDLLDNLKREIRKSRSVENENENLKKEIIENKKKIKTFKNEIISSKKEIVRNKKQYEARIRRLELRNDTELDNSYAEVIKKTEILEALLFYIGKKFDFDGKVLVDIYKVVDDPNDDFLRRLVDNISESYWIKNKKAKTDESKEN